MSPLTEAFKKIFAIGKLSKLTPINTSQHINLLCQHWLAPPASSGVRKCEEAQLKPLTDL